MLGDRVKTFRRQRGWTSKRLAQEAMLSTHTVRFIEENRHLSPRLSTLAMLAAAFDMSLDELVGGPENVHVSAMQMTLLREHWR